MFGDMISRRRGTALYEQVADVIRARIASGEYAPGDKLPSEKYLAEEFDVGRDAIRDAIQILKSQGLVDTRRGYRTTVRRHGERELRALPKGTKVFARMPTPDEAVEHGIQGEGVPVLVVDGQVYPGDRYEFVAE